ncbi:MAG: cell filamentation protein Fic [Legionellales bacterium]|nr:MAG: cell filamentation protein Fic [Legionellales bacterium]
MNNIAPPFQITPNILQLSQVISRALGMLSGAKLTPVPIKLRRENKIQAIHSSLGIEGNTLTLEQITHVLDGHKIIAAEKDIIEVQNAITVYDNLANWNPLSKKNFQQVHKLLLQNLTKQNGKWRSTGVGIFKGKAIAHMAPPANKVPELMLNLFAFLSNYKDIPWLIKACVFHYELEFIHPFIDGNGRMGRLWQQLLLMQEDPIFEFISVEPLIKNNQDQYYKVLQKCDHAGNSTAFIEYTLQQILTVLQQYTNTASTQVIGSQQRLEYAREHFTDQWLTRKQYLGLHKNISTATASRDLSQGIQQGMLIKQGSNNKVCYQFTKSSPCSHAF